MSVLHAAQKTANKHLKSPHRYPVNPDRASIRLFFRRLLGDKTPGGEAGGSARVASVGTNVVRMPVSDKAEQVSKRGIRRRIAK